MKSRNDLNSLLEKLRAEKADTWFDLGLFIDRFREEHALREEGFGGTYEDFSREIKKGGIGFITFHFMVDGVTVEVGKYAHLFERLYPGIFIHYIGGKFRNRSETLINPQYRKYQIPELAGFDEWDLYEAFFKTQLERGSRQYNQLVGKFWNQTLQLVEKIGTYIEEEGISILYVINVCSNPGNVSAALSLVLLSEFLSIPVINNNHDFYFEGGNSRFDRESKNLKKGPRDFFFTNAHLGELFSIIETIYPWESNLWMNVNINRSQSNQLIRYKGHNPARVAEIGTAVDTSVYTKNDKRRNINAFLQFEHILSRYGDQLTCFSVEDVEKRELVSEKDQVPILIGKQTGRVERFSSENIIFLQPTRIISRKRIELGISLIMKLLENREMRTRMNSTPNLKITLLISGPIATGHHPYFLELIRAYDLLMNEVPAEFRNRVYLALLMGEIDQQSFIERYDAPISIPDLYNIASLILLPSKTEGRGLPIIEATACGTPIFCCRYEPEAVYSEVVGEHLGEDDRLRVQEFRGKKISKRIVSDIIERVFFPHKYAEDTRHNIRTVQKRYSLEALSRNISSIVQKLHAQLQPEFYEAGEAKKAFMDYAEMMVAEDNNIHSLLHEENRQYLPGYGKLSFMLYLKSLIDPSFFRIEQQRVRGSVFYFAREILHNDPEIENIPEEKIEQFYRAVDRVFFITNGNQEVLHDHSMSYRHRNRRSYLYQQYTFQELTGVVNLLYMRIVQPAPHVKIDLSPQFFTDWNLALLQLSTSNYLAIDNRKLLIEKLKANLPIAYFPGEFIMYELEFFALQAIRSRLDLPIEKELTRDILERRHQNIAPVYIFAQKNKLGKQLNRREIENYIENGRSEELRILHAYRLIRIIQTNQLCVGIHFYQLGANAISTLVDIALQGGFLLTNRRHAALMTDIVNIDRFHIGRVRGELAANIMGIPPEAGYIQYVPAGLRATIAYPTPVQTALDLDRALHSEQYQKLKTSMGERKLREKLREDAENKGTPVFRLLEKLNSQEPGSSTVSHEHICGKYADGNPYNGVYAMIHPGEEKWEFSVAQSGNGTQTVSSLAGKFEKETGKSVRIAWNGGYILNAELVGKLGMPESYIGSPLGLLVRDGTCLCPPLFNKAAFLIDSEGRLSIRRVNCRSGLVITAGHSKISFAATDYNTAHPREGKPAYYDLMYTEEIPLKGRVLVRLSGRRVMEILHNSGVMPKEIVPVGLTFSIPEEKVPDDLIEGTEVKIEIKGLKGVQQAVEAGPLLLKEGKPVIDMEKEGWTSCHSIETQAARLDYMDMRGPKIAVGLNEQGTLVVLAIHGRIRESVGATHTDMARILAKHGMDVAMGFDPGGSSTLYVDGITLNISPYNSNYEYNVYALPPEPRAVSNAILGTLK